MIKSLHITNFQSYAKTELNFHRGVNIIIGQTDSGKSALVRALRWLVWGRPAGNSICSHWGGKTSVELYTKEGSVLRTKDKGDTYLLVPATGEDLTFKAFGTEVPQEVQMFFNFNEINLQQQLDNHFLLSKSPGEVAQHFNKVAKLDKIDSSIQNINKWIRELTSDITYKENAISTQKSLLEKFDYLEKFEVDIEVLEEAENRLKNKRQAQTKLLGLITSYSLNKIELNKLEEFTQLEPLVTRTLNEITELKEQEKKWNKLYKLITESARLKKEKIRLNELTELEPTVDNILKMYEKLETQKSLKMRLSKAITSLNYISTQIKDYEAKHTRLLKEFKKEMGDVCILCGQPIGVKYIPSRLHKDDEIGQTIKK